MNPASYCCRFIFRMVLLLCLVTVPTTAQDEDVVEYDDSDMWAERSFVIVGSTGSYETALEIASNASYYLDLMLDLRELGPDSTVGLTWSPEICEGTGWEHPCYVARGRFDNGVYVSIEHSGAYEGFAPDYYIVVAASGESDSPIVRETLAKAREFTGDAYIKKTRVYMGCMH